MGCKFNIFWRVFQPPKIDDIHRLEVRIHFIDDIDDVYGKYIPRKSASESDVKKRDAVESLTINAWKLVEKCPLSSPSCAEWDWTIYLSMDGLNLVGKYPLHSAHLGRVK